MGQGKIIKQIREIRNYNQAYLATALGISVSSYSKIERDVANISEKRLKKIAFILNVNLNTILRFDAKKMLSQFDYTRSQKIEILNNKNDILDFESEDDLDFEKMELHLDKLKSIISKLKRENKN